MAAPRIVIDGLAGYGTQLLTINGVTYTADTFQVQRPVEEAHDRDQLGRPARSRYTAALGTGTATLQAPSGTSGWPKFGDTFSITVDDNYGSETFVLMPVENDSDNETGNIRKMPITFKKVINSITTVA